MCFSAQAMYIYTYFGSGVCKTLNLKNGRHFVLLGDLKNIIFRAQAMYIYMGGGKPTAARRPTAASQHNPMYIYIWAAASQQRPEGQLRRANTTLLIYIYIHAHIIHHHRLTPMLLTNIIRL